METATAARNYPRGDLALSACPACGFICNVLFDEQLNAYSPNCEESQHHSPTFDKFAQSLAHELVEDYDVRGQTVLEIGCGKGDFLTQLCELGNNRGIGIDPACRPERLQPSLRNQISLRPELYNEQHAQIAADVVLCRHALEHIAAVAELLEKIRRWHAHTPDTLVVFEVPDTTRVLREHAFWDIYYEHCSYFTEASLRDLFHRSGFEVIDCQLAYHEQYIVLIARAQKTRPLKAVLAENKALHEDVESFTRGIKKSIECWKQRIIELHNNGHKPVLWGGGSKAVSFLAATGLRNEIAAVVDINPHKQGRFLPGTGHAVVSPADAITQAARSVIIMNPVYLEEIRTTLLNLGHSPELIALD
ncbi:MAG: class I SAM-dependent methyltransferase [Oceanococcus sp.]